MLPRRILIVRLGALGDVVNALVLATALEQADPDVEIGWAVHDLALPLVTNHPAIDRVHLWPRGTGREGFRALLDEVRGVGYDLAIDLQRIQKSALLARLSRAPRVLGYDRRRAKELSWLWTRERIPPGPPRAPMVEQYMEFARYLGVDGEPRRVLPVDPAAEAWAEELVASLGRAPLVMAVGASKPRNRWEPARFAALARSCVADPGPDGSLDVCLVGGPDDRELFAETLRLTAGCAGIHDLVGMTDVPRLVSLLRRARLFVGCDTGPMHVAAAVDTPVVALFGPADPRRTGPYGEGHRVVRERSMADVTVEAVRQALEEALRGAPAQAVAPRPGKGT